MNENGQATVERVYRLSEFITERATYTVAEFCEAHRISRAHLYCLWKEGKGPKRMEGVGTKVLISVESARAWRARMETEAQAS